MGGGGSNRQTQTTSQIIPPELRGAYSGFGTTLSNVFNEIGPSIPGFMTDQTPQQIAGPTSLERQAYRRQAGMMNSQGPQAWQDALGMYGQLGNLPGFQGADFSNISGWGQQPGGGGSNPALRSAGMAQQALYDPGGTFNIPDDGGPGTEYGQPGEPRGGGGGQTDGTVDPRAAAMGLDPTQAGGSARQPGAPGTQPKQGFIDPAYTQANTAAGAGTIQGRGQLGGPAGGQVREIDLSKYGGGRGGGGGGGWSFSAGGGGDVEKEARLDTVLDKIDFANHPALASALDTFAKTALPGIENSMIGAGLGRSGAAANAISTGKAQIALPVMQQLIQGELTQRGQDVTQRGQDTQANIAAANAAAQARAQGASIAAQREMARLAAEQTMRQQDISLRGQDINAALANAGMGLDARGQDINALLAGAGGLADLGQADISRIQNAISGGMGIGGEFRNMQNQINEAEFNAANRPFDRFMSVAGMLAPGAMGAGGSKTVSTGGGGK